MAHYIAVFFANMSKYEKNSIFNCEGSAWPRVEQIQEKQAQTKGRTLALNPYKVMRPSQKHLAPPSSHHVPSMEEGGLKPMGKTL